MESPNVITLLVDEACIDKMRSFYAEDILPNPNPFALLFAKGEGFSLTVYNKEKDGKRKAVFQGGKASEEARIWGEVALPVEAPLPPQAREEIGSDEVGTGDFFGPVIVVACHITSADRAYLRGLGVTDSKALTDERIRQIGPRLIQRYDYSQLCLPNDRFNELTQQGLNMNAIKAKMHNRCLLNLALRHPKAKVFQDQFAAPKTYYSYLRGEKEIVSRIYFATKGESKFLSVAAASIIARYSFLRHMDELSKEYGASFPYGAGPKVEEFAKAFVETHGVEALKKVAKTNFATMKKILK